MSNEYKDQMLQLLTEVDNVKASEAALQTEKLHHQEQIAKSEADLQRTKDEIEQCRETALGLRRQMDNLKDQIFARPEVEEETVVLDEAHIPSDGEGSEQRNTAAKQAWDERARHLRKVQ